MDLYDNANLQGLLRRDLHTPLYHQLRQLLREQIQRGELRDGQQLPREEDLAKRLGISRVTVRLALAELAEEGLLVRQRGRGTRITSGRSRNPGHAGPPPLGECESPPTQNMPGCTWPCSCSTTWQMPSMS